jgi:ribonuclease P protein component
LFPVPSRRLDFDRRSPATPESAKEWRDAGGWIRLAQRPSAKTRGLPARVSGEPKAFVGIDELFFSRTIERGSNRRAPRVGLTAGRVLGGAVERNRIRRRMREAVRLHLGELPLHVDVVLHPRKTVLEMEFARLEREVARVFASVADGAEGKR